ncbi:sodium/potassium/calcium exchanger 1-like [Astyanax mexicanus]|uniref:sodium/potassium/calcium exchanger 1-like n=1 Tax=Astyanax mexicanus TaxID=7994 RepID=UPI0020CB192C|nr:sodium/potassium/calcium exchanger 1-like [Astyanax mexicanus]
MAGKEERPRAQVEAGDAWVHVQRDEAQAHQRADFSRSARRKGVGGRNEEDDDGGGDGDDDEEEEEEAAKKEEEDNEEDDDDYGGGCGGVESMQAEV